MNLLNTPNQSGLAPNEVQQCFMTKQNLKTTQKKFSSDQNVTQIRFDTANKSQIEDLTAPQSINIQRSRPDLQCQRMSIEKPLNLDEMFLGQQELQHGAIQPKRNGTDLFSILANKDHINKQSIANNHNINHKLTLDHQCHIQEPLDGQFQRKIPNNYFSSQKSMGKVQQAEKNLRESDLQISKQAPQIPPIINFYPQNSSNGLLISDQNNESKGGFLDKLFQKVVESNIQEENDKLAKRDLVQSKFMNQQLTSQIKIQQRQIDQQSNKISDIEAKLLAIQANTGSPLTPMTQATILPDLMTKNINFKQQFKAVQGIGQAIQKVNLCHKDSKIDELQRDLFSCFKSDTGEEVSVANIGQQLQNQQTCVQETRVDQSNPDQRQLHLQNYLDQNQHTEQWIQKQQQQIASMQKEQENFQRMLSFQNDRKVEGRPEEDRCIFFRQSSKRILKNNQLYKNKNHLILDKQDKGDYLIYKTLNQDTKRMNQLLQCKFCGMKFPKLCNLKDHLRIHQNLKPYQCHTCQKTFIQLGNMKKHQMRGICRQNEYSRMMYQMQLMNSAMFSQMNNPQ